MANKINENIVAHKFKYGAMLLETRKKILPERNVCSLYPAESYKDCFWVGNGHQKVEVMGNPYEDEMAFAHELLYEPQWVSAPEPPDLTRVMPEVRKKLLEGKFIEAADLVEDVQKKAGYELEIIKGSVMPTWSLHLHKAFWLKVTQPEAGETKNYLRWIDLLAGKYKVQWENDNGAFSREMFSAYAGDAVVQRFLAPKGKLDTDITIRLPETDNSFFIPMGIVHPEDCEKELEMTEELFTLKWAYNPEYGQKGYVSVIRFIRTGGKTELIENGVRVSGADSLMIISKTIKFEGDFTFECAQPVVDEVLAMDADFDQILQGNLEYLGARMKRSQLRLGKKEDFALSAEELLRRTHSEFEFDGTLLDKLYDMGRIYQIMDTGEIPPMHGQHNINTNLQVCAGNNTGLLDEMDVYFRYYETKFDDFRTNAKKLFGARGLLCSIHCDYDSGLYYHFSKTYPHYCWTGCLGWIYNELWNYWLVTGDKEFLRTRLVPALKEIALFFEDYACDRGPDGRVIFYPSFSPENPTPDYVKGGTYSTSINSVMDIMICREVLDNLMDACNVLGIEQENIAHWQEQKASLPRYLLDEEGGLKEWAWPTIEENYDHRHVSHHYDVWPGHVITWEDEPDMAEAILISNRKRSQQNDSAHGIIHRLFTAIRLKDIPETVQNLYQLMNHGFITRALHTYHNPYSLHDMPDLQGAMPAILLEMCIYSAPGTVEFLPSMPDSLREGGIDGVWLYTWAKLEKMDWDENGLNAVLVSNKAQKLTLRCRRSMKSFKINGKPMKIEGDSVCYEFKAGESIQVTIDFA